MGLWAPFSSVWGPVNRCWCGQQRQLCRQLQQGRPKAHPHSPIPTPCPPPHHDPPPCASTRALPPIFFSPSCRVVWFGFLAHVMLPQRGATFAYPLVCFVLLVSWVAVHKRSTIPLPAFRSLLCVAAVSAGSLPLVQVCVSPPPPTFLLEPVPRTRCAPYRGRSGPPSLHVVFLRLATVGVVAMGVVGGPSEPIVVCAPSLSLPRPSPLPSP